jgi:hypothetical protein
MSYKLCRKISSSIWTFILLAPVAILLVIVLLLATISGREGSWLFKSSVKDPKELTYRIGRAARTLIRKAESICQVLLGNGSYYHQCSIPSILGCQ